MSDDLPQDIRKIIAAQTEVNVLRSVTLPVLPKIGNLPSSSKSPNQSTKRKCSNSSKKSSLGFVTLPRLTQGIDNMGLVARRNTPMHEAIAFGNCHNYSHSSIPEKEALPSAQLIERESSGNSLISSAALHGTIDFDRTFVIRREKSPTSDVISELDMKFATIPDSLPDIDGLQNVVDNLSSRRMSNILDACRLYDHELRGYLSVPSLIKCFGEVIPGVQSPSSPWRSFLLSLAPDGEFIEYEALLQLLDSQKRNVHFDETIPDLIVSAVEGEEDVSFRPSTGQESRERTRAQVMTEIEVLLMRNPELTLERLKVATTKKVIETSEFKMLLEMYGLESHFQPFFQRLVSCFRTHDGKFHFCAFVGCLALVRPPVTHSAPPEPPTPLWHKSALPPIGKSEVSANVDL